MAIVCTVIMISVSVCRDIEERGRDLEQVLKQYIHLVKPAFEEFTLPVRHSVNTRMLSQHTYCTLPYL